MWCFGWRAGSNGILSWGLVPQFWDVPTGCNWMIRHILGHGTGRNGPHGLGWYEMWVPLKKNRRLLFTVLISKHVGSPMDQFRCGDEAILVYCSLAVGLFIMNWPIPNGWFHHILDLVKSQDNPWGHLSNMLLKKSTLPGQSFFHVEVGVPLKCHSQLC